MNTLTIPEKKVTTIASTTINLPYYAKYNDGISSPEYFAITGTDYNIRVTVGERIAAINNCLSATSLPGGTEQISLEAFCQAYEKAQLMITDKFLQSCPSLTLPPLTSKTV